MKNGLYDIGILSFVFTPLLLTITVLLCVWRVRTGYSRSMADRASLLLASAVRRMPVERRDWGVAMIAELDQLRGWYSRWWFALSCARVALFPPRAIAAASYHFPKLIRPVPICGAMSVALPPLGLPFLYLAALVVETIGGSHLTESSRWSNPAAAIEMVRAIMLVMFLCIVSGLPLGIAGLFRRERARWLSVMGPLVSLCTIGYVIIAMRFLAGDD
jgi:hypothetical protein